MLGQGPNKSAPSRNGNCLSVENKIKAAILRSPLCRCARCVIFPGRRQPSIVTVNELNYCVRNGNRCTLVTNSTHLLFFSGKEKRIRFAPYRRFCFLYLSRNSISLSHQTDFVKTENGDPCGIRTHVNGVRGRCLNHLTNGPHSVLRSIPFHEKRIEWCTIGDSNPGPTD